ncbi:hypothetical protein [Actinoplanes sp. NPDC051859]|uniref:hypothetical protein n=1 Tax=Actinoplanes sp. NPDC051859 TaxID=3363909 RepID=UPI0037B08ACD
MPAAFSVHIDPDDLAHQNLAAALSTATASPSDRQAPALAHHGAQDDRQAARERSGWARSGRAATAGTGRSYAFRRS